MSEIAFVLRFPALCTEGVTRRDEFQPCDKPAVAVRFTEGDGLYPVCAHHARVDMVPLPALIAAVRAQAAAEIEDYTDAVLGLVDTRNGARLAFVEIVRIARDGRTP